MAQASAEFEVSEEDQLRAKWYAVLAQLLARPPDQDTLDRLAQAKGDGSEFGEALTALGAAARAATAGAVEREYFDLFIGVSQGELVPYGSYYLSGFLYEKPLARLRGDMAALGIARSEGVKEPEDHIAALCDMMAGLITGGFGQPAELAAQRRFFDDHLGCWAPRFFEDLQAAKGAAFYMPVGKLGSLFMAVESQAFEMAA